MLCEAKGCSLFCFGALNQKRTPSPERGMPTGNPTHPRDGRPDMHGIDTRDRNRIGNLRIHAPPNLTPYVHSRDGESSSRRASGKACAEMTGLNEMSHLCRHVCITMLDIDMISPPWHLCT
jgi:hypothetical protein